MILLAATPLPKNRKAAERDVPQWMTRDIKNVKTAKIKLLQHETRDIKQHNTKEYLRKCIAMLPCYCHALGCCIAREYKRNTFLQFN